MNVRALSQNQAEVARKMHVLRERLAALEESLNEAVDPTLEVVENMSSKISSMAAKVKHTIDVPSHIKKYPFAAIGIATVAGIGAGAWLGRPQSARNEDDERTSATPSVGGAFVSAIARHAAEFAAAALVTYAGQAILSRQHNK